MFYKEFLTFYVRRKTLTANLARTGNTTINKTTNTLSHTTTLFIVLGRNFKVMNPKTKAQKKFPKLAQLCREKRRWHVNSAQRTKVSLFFFPILTHMYI